MLILRPNSSRSKSLDVWNFKKLCGWFLGTLQLDSPWSTVRANSLWRERSFRSWDLGLVSTCHSPCVLRAAPGRMTCVLLKHARHVPYLCVLIHHSHFLLWLLKPLCILKLTSSLKPSLMMLSIRVSFFPWGSHSTVHGIRFQHSPQAIAL